MSNEGPISKDELRKLIEDLATPADAEAMVARGALALTDKPGIYRIADKSKILDHEASKLEMLTGGRVKVKAVTKAAMKMVNKIKPKK